MTWLHFLAALVSGLILSARAQELNLRIIKVQMSSIRGSGMDGGKFGVQAFGGGKFEFQICAGDSGKVRKHDIVSCTTLFRYCLHSLKVFGLYIVQLAIWSGSLVNDKLIFRQPKLYREF